MAEINIFGALIVRFRSLLHFFVCRSGCRRFPDFWISWSENWTRTRWRSCDEVSVVRTSLFSALQKSVENPKAIQRLSVYGQWKLWISLDPPKLWLSEMTSCLQLWLRIFPIDWPRSELANKNDNEKPASDNVQRRSATSWYIHTYVAQNMTVNTKNIKAQEGATMIPTFLENGDNIQVVELTFLDTGFRHPLLK